VRIGRRDFLAAGGGVAGAGLLPAFQASAAPVAGGRSATDFGVEPNKDADQTEALQKAIDAISAEGEAVYLPGGLYRLAQLQLPARCAIIGVPGQTRLTAQTDAAICRLSNADWLFVSGLTFEGSALSGNVSNAIINGIAIPEAPGSGIAIGGVTSASISDCFIERCKKTGIDIETGPAVQDGAILTGNHIALCPDGIALKGNGNVSGNYVAAASRYGLRLGGASEAGSISAVNNTIIDCGIGVGVAAGMETMLVSLNLINRMRLSVSSAIRAFDGDKLIGPDLAFESAEAYLNVTVVGNVAR
jgi:hypothetical protein